jgi:hypothetical protein
MSGYTDDLDSEYINSIVYSKLVDKINNLKDVSFDLTSKVLASRKLRYAEVDIEVERNVGRIAPDEMYVPLHIIDTNIRREQSAYIQYITQSPRAVILKDKLDPAYDLSLLEVDLTEKLRFDGWQLSAYANIDGFQANGYGIMETVQDTNNSGDIGREYVQFGDFSFIADTRDLQKCEMVGRAYYYTKTKLKEFQESGEWNRDQLDKIINSQPNDEQSNIYSGTATINRSLYKLMKIMFRVKGVVQVGWACPPLCEDWLRKPRPLFVGRRKINEKAAKSAPFVQAISKLPVGRDSALKALKSLNPELTDKHVEAIQQGRPPSDMEYETMYPYFLYPYLISENDTIACLKGRIFLDQDTQNAASSLLSSLLTKARRSAGLYFSKDTTDPNDDFLMQKDVYFKTGALINGKIKEFELDGPDAQLFTALQTLISANQQETSQVNFAENNRQADSRKTATAIKTSVQQQQQLSGVQVTLYSIANKAQLTYECGIIKSRVLAGLIKVQPQVQQMYAREWAVKPSGDVDVIEKQKMIETMQNDWPVVQNTAAAPIFLTDLLEKQFPDSAQRYVQAINQQIQDQKSQQAQQMQTMMGIAKQTAQGIIKLSEHPEWFSDTGRVHAFPVVESAAEKFEQMMNQKGQVQNGQSRQ